SNNSRPSQNGTRRNPVGRRRLDWSRRDESACPRPVQRVCRRNPPVSVRSASAELGTEVAESQPVKLLRFSPASIQMTRRRYCVMTTKTPRGSLLLAILLMLAIPGVTLQSKTTAQSRGELEVRGRSYATRSTVAIGYRDKQSTSVELIGSPLSPLVVGK